MSARTTIETSARLRILPGESPTPTDECPGELAVLNVVAWADPVIDSLGHDPRSWYVEQFWLATIGPTSAWLLRRMAAGLDTNPDGFEMDLAETARMLGVGAHAGAHSPLRRALARCVRFELAKLQGMLVAVRRRVPPLPRRHLLRLPTSVQHLHEQLGDVRRHPAFADQRRRARKGALELLEAGDDRETVEVRLMRWGVHPALAGEAVEWAIEVRAASRMREVTEGVTARLPARNTPFTCSS